ncbi:S1 family peptidase [Ramlibacter sp. MMS24-I3-19]|uniref:S1 family peptidase n=1 Tax=Ramlibacter sp. MMS24-I3-19 TaxID=3416606 RepID=UPI003D017535
MPEPTERRRWLRAHPAQPELQPQQATADVSDAANEAATSSEESGAPAPARVASQWSVPRLPVPALDVAQVESLLLTTVQITTLLGGNVLTRASGFFFRRDDRLFLVTSRHVLFDAETGHLPDAIEIGVHTAAADLARSASVRFPLYADGRGLWHQGRDRGGEIDVAVLEVERGLLPPSAVLHAFAPEHLLSSLSAAEVGLPVLLVGFPLGFHDTLHHLPVVRHAIIASSFGLRFQGQGCFLTDGRAHRGSSGAPVVMRSGDTPSALPWKLLGVHSSRFDMGGRDMAQDESLGLNCAWYADILVTLTG